MPVHRRHQITLPKHSQGVATLELVLSLPVVLILMVGVVWLGSSVVAQNEVTIDARHKTWSKRKDASGQALLFLKDDLVSDEATKPVEVSPIFDDVENPESSHDVMAAAWDHENLSLDDAPNWKEYAIAAANAKTGSIQNGYTDAQNQFAKFRNQAGNIWNTIGASMIRQLNNLGASANEGLEGGEESGADEKERLEAHTQKLLDDNKTKLNRAHLALRNLKEDAPEARRKVLKNRVKRLEAEVDDLKEDLRALR